MVDDASSWLMDLLALSVRQWALGVTCFVAGGAVGGFGPRAGLSATASMWMSYLSHRLAHSPWGRACMLHAPLHHHPQQPSSLPVIRNTASVLVDFYVGCGVWLALVPGAARWLDVRVLVLGALVYTLTHLVVYHGDDATGAHAAHHRDVRANFGPPILDVLMRTYTPETLRDDGRSVVPLVAVTAAAVCLLSAHHGAG